MTDGQAAETPPGTPGRRALGAMETAVRRAREAQGGLPPPRPLPPPAPPPPTRSPERWLFAGVAAAAVLVVAAAIALAVSLSGNPRPGPPGATTAAAPHTPSVPRSSARGTKGGHSASGTSARTTTTTAPSTPTPTGPVGAPVISSLSPSNGSAGEGVQITGANFLSSDGQIVATFNGQVAPTSCTAENTCTVTVPPPSGSSPARVSITTASGTSNAVTFTYG